MNNIKPISINNGHLLAEKTHISNAIKKGYEDPLCNDQKSILFIESNQKIYRRFIVGFHEIPHTYFQRTQVREKNVDESYCREDLIPLIQRDGIRCPIWITWKGHQSAQIEHGHHREFSDLSINGEASLMPCFELSDFVCLIKSDGSYGKKISSNYLDILSKIGANPPPPNLTYKYVDVPHQLRELYSADSTFNGINVAGQIPDRNLFDKIMDDIHPNAFLNKSTRTKIYNLWQKGSSRSKIKVVNFGSITNDLVMCRYDAGVTQTVRGKPKREKFLSWYDSNRNVYLGIANTNANGATFERDYGMPLIKKMGDGLISKNDTYNIVLHCTMYNPPATLVEIKQKRNDMTDLLKAWNTRFTNLGYPNIKFKSCIYPKQLTDPNDKCEIVQI
jgi:hypothetical protein